MPLYKYDRTSRQAGDETSENTVPLLTVIMPVYNERGTVLEIIARVRSIGLNKQIIIVDDGSTDGSGSILQEHVSDWPEATLLSHPRNLGKGAAIRTALPRVSGRFTIIQDADLEYDPADYSRLLAPLLEGCHRVVYGSRVLGPDSVSSSTLFYLGGRFISLVTNLLYGSNLTDEPTCYKVFETALLKNLQPAASGFDFCAEVTAKTLRAGLKIREVPIRYHPRKPGQGKKLKMRDGWIALWVLLKYRFLPPLGLD
nr:glycosyltransferase family 2 protein [uncultured Sphaerochaeta sp.]